MGTFTKTQGPQNVELGWGLEKDVELHLAMLSRGSSVAPKRRLVGLGKYK